VRFLFAALVLASLGVDAYAQPRTPTAAVLSPEAAVVAAQEGGAIHVWDRASGKKLAEIKSASFFRGAVAPGALIGVVDDGIRVWRGPRYQTQVKLRAPKVLSMGRALISQNGKVAVALYPKDGGVGDPNTVGVWDAHTGATRATLGFERGRVLGVALSVDGETLALFGDEPGRGALLRVVRLAARTSRELLRWQSADRTTYSAALSVDGRLLALGAGERLLIWDLPRRALIAEARTDAIKALFPAALRGPAVQMPGAHQVVFAPDGKNLCTLHAFGVVGVALWQLGRGPRATLRPTAWIKRPQTGGTMRQLAFDPRGKLWLISATFSPSVWVHTPQRDRFVEERVLAP
jgi:hypothetical protein